MSSFASISLSGNASVVYEEIPNITTGSANLVIKGEHKDSTLTATLDLVSGDLAGVTLETTIGPIKIFADLIGDWQTVELPITDSVTLLLDNSWAHIKVDVMDNLEVHIPLNISGGPASIHTSFAGFDINWSNTGVWDVSTSINNVDIKVDNTDAIFISFDALDSQIKYDYIGRHQLSVSRDLDSGTNLTVMLEHHGVSGSAGVWVKASVKF